MNTEIEFIPKHTNTGEKYFAIEDGKAIPVMLNGKQCEVGHFVGKTVEIQYDGDNFQVVPDSIYLNRKQKRARYSKRDKISKSVTTLRTM